MFHIMSINRIIVEPKEVNIFVTREASLRESVAHNCNSSEKEAVCVELTLYQWKVMRMS